jgi:hypothetical protein
MTLTPYKGRSVNFNKVVSVYRNLHGRTPSDKWSIRQDGVVVAHAGAFGMSGVMFKVSEKGRQRVLRERAKNVHAFLVGKINQIGVPLHQLRVSYNPYEDGYFRVSSGSAITFSNEVWVCPNGVFVTNFMGL